MARDYRGKTVAAALRFAEDMHSVGMLDQETMRGLDKISSTLFNPISHDGLADKSTHAAARKVKVPSFAEEAYRRTISDFASQIANTLKSSTWTTEQAAKKCRLSEDSLNDLLESRTDRFTAAGLLDVATAMGWKVTVTIEPA